MKPFSILLEGFFNGKGKGGTAIPGRPHLTAWKCKFYMPRRYWSKKSFPGRRHATIITYFGKILRFLDGIIPSSRPVFFKPGI